MHRSILPALALVLGSTAALAQTPNQAISAPPSELYVGGYRVSTTNPLPTTATLSGTVTSTTAAAPVTATANGTTTSATAGTFTNTTLGENATRKGCLITNTGTGSLYVFEGASGSASIAASTGGAIPPGGSYSCNLGLTVNVHTVSVAASAASNSYSLQEYN